MRGLPRPNLDPPYVVLRNMIEDFVDAMRLAIQGKDNERDLYFMLAEAEGNFFNAIRSSIAQFSLGNYEEKQRGVLTKTANVFFFELERGM
jgi:hypothetical protein